MVKLSKVMIIDDDEISNFICKQTIQNAGFADEVIALSGGREGLDYLSSLQEESEIPELILLDINMPGMNGWEFLDEYNEILKSLSFKPVLAMLSSSVHESDLEKANAHNDVHDYITKPLTKETLEKLSSNHF